MNDARWDRAPSRPLGGAVMVVRPAGRLLHGPGAVASAGDPSPADVILPGSPFVLRASASFTATGPTIAAGTPTRIRQLTEQVQFNADGSPVILAEVEVVRDPGEPSRRGYATFTLADFRPAPGTGPELLTALLEAFGRASARRYPALAAPVSTPTQAGLSLWQTTTPPPPRSPRTGAVVAGVVGGAGVLATALYLLRRRAR